MEEDESQGDKLHTIVVVQERGVQRGEGDDGFWNHEGVVQHVRESVFIKQVAPHAPTFLPEDGGRRIRGRASELFSGYF